MQNNKHGPVSENQSGPKTLSRPTDEGIPVDADTPALQLDVLHAWAAGMVDGDGYIGAVVQHHTGRATPSIRIRVVVSQNDHYTLSVLKGVLGERGALNALKRQSSQNRHPYQLLYDGRHAIAVIKKILPYLVRKAAEADACLKLQVQGEVGRCPGPKGFSAETHERRAYWVNRLKRMK
jgi:hypothetical protein